MALADLAIINSGLTKYETLSMGLPSVVISNHPLHVEIMDDFEKETEALIHLGYGKELSISKLSQEIRNIIGDYQSREKMSEKGKELIDGLGLKRLAYIITQNI